MILDRFEIVHALIILICLLAGCNPKPNRGEVELLSLDRRNVLFIQNSQIVFVAPDSVKKDSLFRTLGLDEYFKSLETAHYYNTKFEEYLKNRKLSFIKSDKRYNCFISKNNDTLCFDTYKVSMNWYLLIFDGYNFLTYISNISVPED